VIDEFSPAALEQAGAWRTLETQLRPFVVKRVAPSEVDDVLQEIFLRIQRGLPSLRDEQRFGPWVYRVARSAIVDQLRARKHQLVGDLEVPPEEARLPDEPDEGKIGHEVAAYAALFLGLLPSPYREALTLTELQGLSQREAAAAMGISVSGMKSRVQRGRKMLRAALESCCTIALDARRRVVGCEPRPDGTLPAGCCEPAR